MSRKFLASAPVRLCTVLIVLSLPAAAGGKTELEHLPEVPTSWSTSFDSPVVWQRVTPLGDLMVNTQAGLHGIDPKTGSIRWTHRDLGGWVEDRYQAIPDTPLVVIADNDQDDARVVILDSMDGRIVFDSEAAGVARLLSRHVLYRNGSLLIFGFRPGKLVTTMFMFDIATGKHLWTNDKLLGGESKVTRTLTALFQAVSGESGVVAEPFEIDDEAFLIAAGTGINKIATRSGEILWQIPASGDDVRFTVSARDPDVVFVGAQHTTSMEYSQQLTSVYEAIRISSGSRVWDEGVSVKGGLNDVIFADQGVILAPAGASKGKVKLVDYDSGRSLWGKNGKGVKLQGGVVDHDFSKHGLVVTTAFDNAWTNKGAEYFLNILDLDSGLPRYKKPVKLRGRIRATDVLSSGILFVTDSEINILDSETAGGRPVPHRS
jgi:hypothetical protein